LICHSAKQYTNKKNQEEMTDQTA